MGKVLDPARITERIQVEVIVTGGVGSHHGGGRNQPIERHTETLHFGLIIDKEKRFVLPDRAAQRTAKLIQIKLVSESERNSCGHRGRCS